MFTLTCFVFCMAIFDSAKQQFLTTSEGNFSETVLSSFFVDKTMLIKYIMTQTEQLVVLAPRNFGKSTNLSMMKHFLELQADKNGTVVSPNSTTNYRLFEKLKIRREYDFFNRHFAQYPVIYLNLKQLVCSSSYLVFGRSFRTMLIQMLLKHRYLLRSKNLNLKAPREFFNSIQILLHPSYDPEKVVLMGRRMSKFLSIHFERKCVVLIDGLDTPGTQTWIPGGHAPMGIFGTSSDQRMLDIIGKFLSALLEGNSEFVSHSLASGITRVGSTIVYSNSTSISVFEKEEVGKFYGLTETEVRDLAMRHGRLGQVESLGLWYGGYHIENSLLKLFNTHSVLNFFRTGRVNRVWEAPPSMQQLSELFDYDVFGAFLEKSLDQELPTALIKKYLGVNAIRFKSLLAREYKPKPNDHDLLVQLLLENGYYTASSITDAGVITGVTVPNIEMKEALQELIYTETFFRKKYEIGGRVVRDYVRSLSELSKNESSFHDLLNSTSQIFEKVVPKTEAEFQAPLFIFPTFDSTFRDVTVEYTMNKARREIVLVRKDDTRIMMGVKFDHSSEYEALKQILANNYQRLRNDSPSHSKVSDQSVGFEALKQKALKYKKLKDNSSAPSLIFIGLHFSMSNRECALSYLCDSANISDADTLLLFY